MAEFIVPTNATLHAAKSFLSGSDYFNEGSPNAKLMIHPRWMHLEPFALSMIAAWAGWCRSHAIKIDTPNITKSADYAWRMNLFEHLPAAYHPLRTTYEEAGRFMPIRNVKDKNDLTAAIADISALLHLTDNPESLIAVQYCISELIRNVIEHSGSEQGAYVCAHNFTNAKKVKRVSIGVADCGIGVARHLGYVNSEARESDAKALQLALVPGITGARPGIYGTSDNAGAGLFITRSIAKGSGGYFLIYSGSACYRLLRAVTEHQTQLFSDAFNERHNLWTFTNNWKGTVVALEIRTDNIVDFDSYIGWIRGQIPTPAQPPRRIRFT